MLWRKLTKRIRNRPTETILAVVILVVCGMVAYTQWRDPGPPTATSEVPPLFGETQNGASEQRRTRG